MYAHQVIENLKILMEPNTRFKFQWDKEFLEKIIKLISLSQQFHLEDQTQTDKLFASSYGKPIFTGNSLFAKLPYKYTWFDYFRTKTQDVKLGSFHSYKTGILAVNALNHPTAFQIFIFNFISETNYNFWVPSHLSYQIMPGLDKPITPAHLREPELAEEQIDQIISEDQGDLTALYDGLLLLNCKNIGTETIRPNEKLNAKRRENNKTELFSYHILRLKLPEIKGAVTQKRLSSGGHNRIHFCRGHFKEYTKEHPLFGKIVGLWWWQAHVRGQNKKGIVLKDYEVITKKVKD
jgi:hypothetical protein